MANSAAEQYGIELLNRARLDPVGEARRYGVDLGEGIPAGEINARQKQVLASNENLMTASRLHADWMLDTDRFEHTGRNGSNPDDRMKAAGFTFTGNWSWGENLAGVAMTGGNTTAWAVAYHQRQLMQSPGHRENIMRDSFREIGYSQEVGSFKGSTYSMLTENFASRGTHVFVTGVAYQDRDGDGFYSVGEGRGGVTFTQVGLGSAETEGAGGYSLRVKEGAAVQIRIEAGRAVSEVIVDTTDRFGADPLNPHINVKLDLVDGDTVLASSNLTLVSGVDDARLLGINPFALTGSDDGNRLVGNSGSNRITGEGGGDRLLGMRGRDGLWGGAGNDRLSGGEGRDRVNGGAGDDVLNGGSGGDRFVFDAGTDRIEDFSLREGDRLVLDDALWGGGLSRAEVVDRFADVVKGDVVLDFGAGNVLRIEDWSYVGKLAGAIEII